MDDNYKFARKFEMGVLQDKTVEILSKHFVCRKIELSAEADLTQEKNQARIEIWSPTKSKLGTLTIQQDNILNKAPFMAYLKVRVAKSQKLVKDEVARIQKLQKDMERREKDRAARGEETAKTE